MKRQIILSRLRRYQSKKKKHQLLPCFSHLWHPEGGLSFKTRPRYPLLHGLTGRISCSFNITDKSTECGRKHMGMQPLTLTRGRSSNFHEFPSPHLKNRAHNHPTHFSGPLQQLDGSVYMKAHKVKIPPHLQGHNPAPDPIRKPDRLHNSVFFRCQKGNMLHLLYVIKYHISKYMSIK